MNSSPSTWAALALRASGRACAAAGVLLVSIGVEASAQALSPTQESRLDEVFADLDRSGPGAQVAVILHGDIVYSKGFGLAQVEHDVPITPETIFHVASVSKHFTAMSVLLLEADGALSIDEDVRSYVPEVPDMGAVVTARHLLHHTSGVRDQWELLSIAGWRLEDVITKEHVRRLLMNQRELNFQPGSEYMYSNMGYSLAADLVDRVSDQPFKDFARERIFEPLGMTRTHVHDDHSHVVPHRAYSYRPAGEGYANAVLSYANHGATSLFTTAEDLVTWLDNFRTQQVGGAAVLDKMTTRGVLNDGDTITYALGVQVAPYRGTPTVGHSGADAGFRSMVIWYPEHETGIAVLSNVSSGDPVGRSRRVGHIVLEDALGTFTEEEPESPAAELPEPVDVDREILESYVGLFSTPLGAVRTAMRAGDLWVISPMTTRLVPTSTTGFTAADGGGRAVFHTPDSLTIHRSGGSPVTGTRVRAPTDDELDAYLGTFYAPELKTLYEVRRGSRGLVLHHLRHGDMPIRAMGGDAFQGGMFFLREVRFTRDGAGAVDGFRLTGSRVRDLRFVRLETALPGG